MKQLTIRTKGAADRVMVSSLFKPVNGRTLRDMKYDGGKYKVDPDIPYIGRTVEVGDNIHALYVVRRKDSDGTYVQIRCICE